MSHIAGGTWGISGPTFVLIYVALGIVVVVGIATEAQAPRGTAPPPLDPSHEVVTVAAQ